MTVPEGAPSFVFEASIEPWTLAVALAIAVAIVVATLGAARVIGDRRAGRGSGPSPSTDETIALALRRRALRNAGALADDYRDAHDRDRDPQPDRFRP